MEINYKDTEADKQVILDLLDKFEKEDIKGKEKGNVKRLISLWRDHLENGEFKEDGKKKPPVALERQDVYKMEHTLYDGDKIVMYFDITELRYWMSIKKIPSDTVELIRCVGNINYRKTDDTELTASFDKTPIIAVPMYKMGEDKKFSTYEIADGNRRVSAALHLQRNIRLQMITVPFLPVSVFKNNTSWILYNLIEGVYLMAMGDFPEPAKYLKGLEGFLDYNYPIKK